MGLTVLVVVGGVIGASWGIGGVAIGVAWSDRLRGALDARAGEVGSPGILVAIIVACTATLPVGVYFLPARLRPTDLFTRFDAPISRLPASVRVTLSRVLRLAD